MKTVHLNIHDDLHQYLTKVKEETGYIRCNRNGVRLIKVKTGVLLSDFRNEKPEDKECKK